MTTKRKREYLEYLQSEEWFAIRDKAFEFHGRICLDCSTKRNLQIHHLRYPRVFGQEDIEKDLCVLCKKCHDKRHGFELHSFEDEYIDAGKIFDDCINVPMFILRRIFEIRARCQVIHIILVLLLFYKRGIMAITFSQIQNNLSMSTNGLRTYISRMKQGNIILINDGQISLNFDLSKWKTRRLGN